MGNPKHSDIETGKEKMRRCLGVGCGKLFHSSSPANRFCKLCKKSKRRLEGGVSSFSGDDHDAFFFDVSSLKEENNF